MIYGLNLLLWGAGWNDGSAGVCERLKSIGYDAVELPLFDPDMDYAAIGRTLDDLGLRRTAVTVRTEADNPIDPDAAVRRAGVEATKRTIDCCADANIETLCGPFHSALGHFTGAGPTADEWSRAVESMREVAEHAGARGVTLAVEALNRFECYFLNTHADSTRFVREVDHPACGMMYDTFHANIEEKSVADAVAAGGDKLVHVHISENDRSTPGTGGVNWSANFDALTDVGYDGFMVIEAFGLALPEVAAATKIWRRMFDDEMTLAADGLAFMKDQVERRR